MGSEGVGAVVFDAGPLIAYDRADERARDIVRTAIEAGIALVIPAPVLAQVWRDPRRQARLARLIASETTLIDGLDEAAARGVGELCARSGTSDIADASVVLSARLRGTRVVTADPDDLRRIDPRLDIAPL